MGAGVGVSELKRGEAFAMQRNLYHVLGISSQASQAEVRAAYVRLVKLHHPDVVGNLPGRLESVQQAYRQLIDATLRAEHDRIIAEQEREFQSRQQRLAKRLLSYDQRHAHPQEQSEARKGRWRPKLLLLGGVFIAACTWRMLA